MNRYRDFGSKLGNIFESENIKYDEPMKYHTTFKVGGPADVLVTPRSFEQTSDIIKLCKENNVPYYVIGNGSNLLVKDGGIRGIVIKLTELNKIEAKGENIVAECGAAIGDVSKAAIEASLTGIEFACGIPGSVGGALAMNAGAYNGEISNVLESALIIDNNGEIKRLSKDEMELGYRMSAVLKYGYTVLEAAFKLHKGEREKIKERVDDLTRRRTEKQPLEYPSAGSTFKRPEGHFAAKLIEDSGLKGFHVSDAEVSVKHSGFVINKGNASARDILQLVEAVQKEVKNKFDVDLHMEVRILGED